MSAKLSQLVATPSPDPDDLMYIVRPVEGNAGSKQITNDNLFAIITRNIADKALRFDAPATAPPLSAAGQAALYYSLTQNRLLLSENGGPYQSITSGVGRALPPITSTIFAAGGDGHMHLYNLPANSLPTDGSYFKFNGAGSVIVNPANRVNVGITINFVGTGYQYNAIQLAPGAVNFPQFNSWRMWGEIIRVNVTTLRSVITEILCQSIISAPGTGPAGASGGHLIGTQDQTFTVSPTYFSGPVSLQFFAGAIENATETVIDNQISQDLTTIEVYQF